MSNIRYTYKKVPISTEEAQLKKQCEIDCAKIRLTEAREDLEDAINAPLQTEKTIRVEIRPGDDGYEDAPFEISLTSYLGNVIWKNIENSTPAKPE